MIFDSAVPFSSPIRYLEEQVSVNEIAIQQNAVQPGALRRLVRNVCPVLAQNNLKFLNELSTAT